MLRSDKKSIYELLKTYLNDGFSRLVVLRGDLPSGYGGLGEFKNAVDSSDLSEKSLGTNLK